MTNLNTNNQQNEYNNFISWLENYSQNVQSNKQYQTPVNNMMPNNFTPAPQQGFSQNDFNTACQEEYLNFDGRTLGLYNRGNLVKSWPAQSGRDEYQSSEYQNVPNKGPLPNGQYFANMNEMQHIDDLSLTQRAKNYMAPALNYIGMKVGQWPGDTPAWGNHRVWLNPDENTQMYGRKNMSIHGGSEYGSAGCIDLAGQMGDFEQTVKGKGVMPVNVEYPNQCWIPRSQQ